jgi:hypothetical protein
MAAQSENELTIDDILFNEVVKKPIKLEAMTEAPIKETTVEDWKKQLQQAYVLLE